MTPYWEIGRDLRTVAIGLASALDDKGHDEESLREVVQYAQRRVEGLAWAMTCNEREASEAKRARNPRREDCLYGSGD